ncbi:DUF3566 domain-containing protein [Nonomuraea sp. KC401]|uniref:DUF3566 domain-containing protein n=1 Tax=unclassified Nonomuraea TaxID=2593643 RepID=UPI0010FE4B5F|nr:MULTISPECIES: DUF3566 domain-containing protein [unclassified Nonomuraea]NBE93124.1 DUF3566 domain-containing protein [Nonomuraea sp. K271]TLF82891.1 DUF3566 domain-containing protein [Nonomuraea sp. KC401]
MSAQGGTARAKAASGNGQQPKRPTEKETFDETRDTSPTQGRPFPAKDDAKPAPPPTPPQKQSSQQPEGNDTVRIRPSLATEAPPPPAAEVPKKKSGGAGARLPRKAHLVLRRIEPWSAMKFSFVVSLVCFVVLFVAVAVLYGVLSALGVFDSIVDLVNQLGQGEQGQNSIPIDIASWFEPVRILGYTALIGAVNVVLITALATLGAVIYNVASDLVGGVEVTFSEAE